MDVKSINSDSQGSDEPAPPGTSGFTDKKMKPHQNLIQSPMASPSSPGMLQAKKKLRAFSIQKKAVLAPITVPKPVSTGSATVLIGKLSAVKTTPKPEPADPDLKKPPKPPKPGASRKILQENYTQIQKKNVAEIEDMKRKMELVELGIPLGLICPTSTSEKAMPTKAMPPIKSFLDPSKVDELIREAKKARAEGKNFKFELSKFLPDYDNPFQRKKDNPADTQDDKDYKDKDRDRKDRRKSDKYEFKRHTDYRKKDDKDKDRERYKDRSKDRDKKNREEKEEKKEEPKKVEKVEKGKEKEKSEKDPKETDVNLNDYLVCDSWSLDTEDKNNSSSPKVSNKALKTAAIPLPTEDVAKDIKNYKEGVSVDTPIPPEPMKVEKLKPVIDSFKYELDSNEDEVLDIFDEDTDIDKYAKTTVKKQGKTYDSPVSLKLYDYDQEPTTADDENFLESVINEIKQEDMSDISQDKGLVEYDMSPIKDDDIPRPEVRESVTPELDDRMRDLRSQQSSYSDGYRSSESGYKSRESGYKSDRSESFRLSMEKDLDEALERKMSKSTVESLETWSFILKICQPLLFRHDKNKCYRETHTSPKVWYTENPRRCSCVKDRAVVYEELETCKMPLVDRVYGCDQIAEEPSPTSQPWYPRHTSCFVEPGVPLSNEWETEEPPEPRAPRGGATPRSDEIYLDREYQRFMEAVWPEVSESKPDTPRSTTPVKEVRKKKKADDADDKKKAKKIKLSSEGWSQESEPEEPPEKSKKPKDKERRKRKHSATTLAAESDSDDARKRKKALKRKLSKKTKAKEAKRRRLSKKYLRKLKEKNKKKKAKAEKLDDDSDNGKEKKKEKKAKKKKQLKQKKTQKKKARAKSTSSSSSSSDSSSESSSDEKRKKKIEKRKKKKEKKRKQSSDSTQSEELFDVNILNNIKTERLTDDEKRMVFSPRRHGEKPREIINVKELQNDFVGNNVHIKQEIVEEEKEVTPEPEITAEEPKDHIVTEFKEPEPQAPVVPIQAPAPQISPQPELIPPPEIPPVEESSQCSSQESIVSKDHYEKDDSHLRPSSQNSNYSFNDVMASHGYKGDEIYEKGDQIIYDKGDQTTYPKVDETSQYQKGDEMGQYEKADVMDAYEKGDEMMGVGYQKEDEYEPANYEMYEQMAMAYQSGVASQQSSLPEPAGPPGSQRIETRVCLRRGEIKCDWRAADHGPAPPATTRPSRWGLKPGEVNIVLTGGGEQYQPRPPARAGGELARSVQFLRSGEHGEQVYRIESIANRSADSNTSMSYDEAYMDMYGASDRLQYGDCFSDAAPPSQPAPLALHTPLTPHTPSAPSSAALTTPVPRTSDPRRASTLDARIDLALKNTVLGEVANDPKEEDKDAPEKGILLSKPSTVRASKRVSFADGYTPGQDSDVEAPPRKKKKVRRYGCAWPCPAEHPDHVALWDALPPPPPPASPPPPPAALPPPPALLATLRRPPGNIPPVLMGDPMLQQQLAHHQQKFDPNSSLPPFMPPEPPPGMINFHMNN